MSRTNRRWQAGGTDRPLRIAMIGTRGVPATFGGIEVHVEKLGARLVERGHEVTVYCRKNYVEHPQPTFKGMHLRHLPTVDSKHFDAITHSALSAVDALVRHYDIVHFHALGPGLVAPLPRYLSGAKVVQTIHGLDDERAKWGRVARVALRTAGWMSARVPDATIVVAEGLVAKYEERHAMTPIHIPNGVDPPTVRPALGDLGARLGISAGDYALFVGRLVPEKAPDVLIEAFKRYRGSGRLVIAGGSSFTDGFAERLNQLAAEDPRVVMAGYVYGDDLAALYTNARTFVLPSLLEGLPLTLLEAASYATPVVTSDIPPHVEVLRNEGPGRRLCPPGDPAALALALERSAADPAAERAGAATLRDDVMVRYAWGEVTTKTEQLYRSLLSR